MDPISDRFPWVSTYNYAENEPVGSIDLHGLQKAVVIRNQMAVSAMHVDNDKKAIDALWSTYHNTNSEGVSWKSGQERYNQVQDQPIYKGTLFMDIGIEGEGVSLRYIPEIEPQKERGGITLLTGATLLGAGSIETPSGTSSVIIEDLLIPFGGGGGIGGENGIKNLMELLDIITNLTTAAGNIKSERSLQALIEEKRASMTNDTIYKCKECGGVYRDSSGIKIRTDDDESKPHKEIRTHTGN